VNSALDTNNTTAVHELSHQWWGDKTTCYDFDNPWLNEGFAHFCESLYLERFSGEKKYWTQQHSNIAAALLPYEDTIPLFGAPSHTKPRNNYPSVIYDKGASVLGMLRYSLGDSIFFHALRAYGNLTAYSTATTEDFESIMEDTAMQDLRMFFTEWVYGVGHPALTVLWSKKGDTVNMQFEQTQDSAKIGFFRQPLIIETRTFSGQIERHEVLLDTLRFTEVSFVNSFAPDTLIIDPDGAVIKKFNSPVKLGVWQKQIVAAPPSFALQFLPNPSNEKNMRVSYSMANIDVISTQPILEVYDTNGNRIAVIDLGSPQMDSSNENIIYAFNTGSLASGTYFASLVLNDQITIKGKFIVTK
jgi:aminopeptidase N